MRPARLPPATPPSKPVIAKPAALAARRPQRSRQPRRSHGCAGRAATHPAQSRWRRAPPGPAALAPAALSAGGGPRCYLAIDGGFLEVLEDHVRVLADSAERAEDINVDRAKSDLQRAQEQLASMAAEADPLVAMAAVNRAQARIDAVERR